VKNFFFCPKKQSELKGRIADFCENAMYGIMPQFPFFVVSLKAAICIAILAAITGSAPGKVRAGKVDRIGGR
jgi:hypothetical protein